MSEPTETPFTHLDGTGRARMVDVTGKSPTVRTATATGRVVTSSEVLTLLRSGGVPKGDVLAVARIAGIQAAKRTPELLPLAHTIGVHGAQVDLDITDDGIDIAATVRTADRTGVEMEALTAVTVAALAVVDMVKGIDRSAGITDVRVVAKTGGRSGTWLRHDPVVVGDEADDRAGVGAGLRALDASDPAPWVLVVGGSVAVPAEVTDALRAAAAVAPPGVDGVTTDGGGPWHAALYRRARLERAVSTPAERPGGSLEDDLTMLRIDVDALDAGSADRR